MTSFLFEFMIEPLNLLLEFFKFGLKMNLELLLMLLYCVSHQVQLNFQTLYFRSILDFIILHFFQQHFPLSLCRLNHGQQPFNLTFQIPLNQLLLSDSIIFEFNHILSFLKPKFDLFIELLFLIEIVFEGSYCFVEVIVLLGNFMVVIFEFVEFFSELWVGSRYLSVFVALGLFIFVQGLKFLDF